MTDQEPLSLTESEHRQIAADYEVATFGGPMTARQTVAFIENRINAIRIGDPVGTVRVHNGSVAIRRIYGWFLVHPEYVEERNDERSRVDVSHWPIAYAPQEKK